jgi:long-chain acyl-CoA synthetase
VLHFWDGTLPRTATRKVKRKVVIEELKKLERIASSAKSSREPAAREKGDGWLYDLLAEVSQKGKGTITAETRLASDLGFDSLMLTELQVGLESAGVALAHVENLAELQTVGELAKLVRAAKRTVEVAPVRDEDAETKPTEFEVPAAVARIGRRLLEAGQRVLYESVFEVSIHGQNYIPRTRNFLVVANHSSHLDMGLVKIALGEEGERLTALAARDYFFDTPLKRAYFENFTSLIPMDRHGSLKQSLRLAGEAIDNGYHLLIFPEGTRSKDGKLAEFKPTTGYLALNHDVDILPMYIEGAYEALPKGAILPKARELTVRIGPSLRVDQFRSQIAGVAKSEAYRVITRAVEESVRALSEGRVVPGAKRVIRQVAIPAPLNGAAEHGPTNGTAAAEPAPAKSKPAAKSKRKERQQ